MRFSKESSIRRMLMLPTQRDQGPAWVHQIPSNSCVRKWVVSATVTWRRWMHWQVEPEGIFPQLLTLSRWGIILIIHTLSVVVLRRLAEQIVFSPCLDSSQPYVLFVSQKSLSLLVKNLDSGTQKRCMWVTYSETAPLFSHLPLVTVNVVPQSTKQYITRYEPLTFNTVFFRMYIQSFLEKLHNY